MPTPPLRHNFTDPRAPTPGELPAEEYNLNAVRTDAAYDAAVISNLTYINVKNYGAVGTADDSATITAAIAAAAAARSSFPGPGLDSAARSVVWFPAGTYLFGAITLPEGVYIDGNAARLRPTAGFTGNWITLGGDYAGIGKGAWLNGNNVNGEVAIKVNPFYRCEIACPCTNWGGKVIRDDGLVTYITSAFLSGMMNTTYINSLGVGAYVGAVELAGTDTMVGKVEISASRTRGGTSVAASTNKVVCAVLVSGGMCNLDGTIAEQADIGIRNTGFFNKYKNVRTEFNTTHGFWAPTGSGEIVGCQALGNSRLADNTYDGFFIESPNGWIFDDNVSRSDNPGDGIKHRSGLNFTNTGLTLGAFVSTGGDHKTYQVPVITRIVNSQTGTSYAFVADDNNRIVTFNNASAVTATVETFANIAWQPGTVIEVVNLGAGQVTVTGGAGGPTVNGVPGTKLNQYAGARLLKTAVNTWVITGQLSA